MVTEYDVAAPVDKQTPENFQQQAILFYSVMKYALSNFNVRAFKLGALQAMAG